MKVLSTNDLNDLKALSVFVKSDIHYTLRARAIGHFYEKIGYITIRCLAENTGLGRCEVHRLLKISRLDKEILEAAEKHGTEKYTLLELADAKCNVKKFRLVGGILKGTVKSLSDLKKAGHDHT